ncbi:MAG: S-layer homology domain-containing protein [Candidatus Peribacteraceae bacterium]|nr:S-layer homology domain-containing protein [Candidatus Peribacteraceae bacterium]
MRTFSVITIATLFLAPSLAFAAEVTTPVFSDIKPGAWYETAALRFASLGYFANPKPLADIILLGTTIFPTPSNHFLPQKDVLRSELVSLTVPVRTTTRGPLPSVATFDDVPTTHPAFKFFEQAVSEGWTKGKDGCVGTHPCFAFPDAKLTRGEAAAFVANAFALQPTGNGRSFTDNPSGTWYHDAIQTLIDNCVLQGDDGAATVRPLSPLNRAEMAIILERANAAGTYGVTCGTIERPAYIKSVKNSAPAKVEMSASLLLKKASAINVNNYTITSNRVSAPAIRVLIAKRISPMKVELTTDRGFEEGITYTLAVRNVQTNRNAVLHDEMTFKKAVTVAAR